MDAGKLVRTPRAWDARRAIRGGKRKVTRLRDKVIGLPFWRGAVSLVPLTGGLTNLSFVATDSAGKFVVRCGEDIPVHGISREHERAASVAAFAAGLSPELVHAGPGVMVLRHIEGETLGEADLRRDLLRIVVLLKICHRDVGPRLRGNAGFFDVFDVIRRYVRLLSEGGSSSSSGPDLPRIPGRADALEAAQMTMPVVFGHNDLLPGNLIDDGTRLWLIDWEYAGFGSALFDLANLAANGGFDESCDTALLEAYFERPVSDELQCSFDAMKAASALREATWAMVSHLHLRSPGVDYLAHARDYLVRADAAWRVFNDRHGKPGCS
jgi:thiamine kinase-like enzyme